MRSIRVQFFTFILAILIALLIVLNTYPLTSARDMVFEEKRSAMTAQGNVISSSLSGLDNLNADSISEVLKFLDIDSFTRITVTDTKGQILFTGGDDSVLIASESEDIASSLAGKTVFRSSFVGKSFLSSFAIPVSIHGGICGCVYLLEKDSERADILLSVQSRIQIISIIVTVAALIIAALFVIVLLSRIHQLADSMRIVAAGDYSHRLKVTGKDEITELGNEFNLLTERLDDTERQRRRFVSDASHELKTPLASIRLLSDSIVQNDNIDKETVREFVTDIGSEAERLQRTTEKLLDLSRMDDGIQIVPEPVDVGRVIEDAASLLAPLAAEKNVTLECSLEDGQVIMATSDDVFHIVFNLMENAVKYNVPDGSVSVVLDGTEDFVRISVSDTGIGIPEEDRLNIFGRFYRVDKARSREAGGSGLGLSIVHDAVQLHGGTIAVGHNKPKGSVFIVTFPRPTEEQTGI